MNLKEKYVADMFICAVRYCIGRRTYIVWSMCKIVSEYMDVLPQKVIMQIIKDISEAKDLGSSYDEEEWSRLKEKLEKKLKETID